MLSRPELLLFVRHVIGTSETHNAFVKDKAKLSVVVISVIQKLQNDNLPPHYTSPEFSFFVPTCPLSFSPCHSPQWPVMLTHGIVIQGMIFPD